MDLNKGNRWAREARAAQEALWFEANRARQANEPQEAREAREAREAKRALKAKESQPEREARKARKARKAQEALKTREFWMEYEFQSGLRLAAVNTVKVASFVQGPSGGREFRLYSLACDQAGDKAVADYLHSKEAAKQALLQKARDEGGYG